MKSQIFFVFLLFTFFSLLFAVSPTPALALEEGVLVSPVIIEETIDPGVNLSLQIKVTSGEGQDLYAYPVDFGVDPTEHGTPQFEFEDNQKHARSYSIASWIKVTDDPISFEEGEKKIVPFVVIVPEDAEAGSHFGALIFSTRPMLDEDSGVSVAGEIGTLILLRVSGDIIESGYLDSFVKDKAWYEKPPVDLTTRFKNTGNVHLRPIGNLEIYSIFGKKIDNLPVNDNLGSVLPDSYRKFENAWDPSHSRLIPIMGRFKVMVLLTFAAGQTATKTVSFWIIPYKWLIIVFSAIVLLVVGVRFMIKNFRVARREED
jgi:hypothetical protein